LPRERTSSGRPGMSVSCPEAVLARPRYLRSAATLPPWTCTHDAEAINDPDEALRRLSDVLRPDDVVLLLTSGELGGLIRKIPQLVEMKYPSTS
jgi:hypothetical protein